LTIRFDCEGRRKLPTNGSERELLTCGSHRRTPDVSTMLTAGLPEQQIVSCSEPLSMISEYRVYVTRGKAVGCKHYWGDFRAQADFVTIDQAIAAYRDAPAGYAIDFAVTSGGDTVLVEVNDGFSLGSYGLHPLLYSGLLEARWEELLAPLRSGR
jgi:hypothetical protein